MTSIDHAAAAKTDFQVRALMRKVAAADGGMAEAGGAADGSVTAAPRSPACPTLARSDDVDALPPADRWRGVDRLG